MLMQDNIVLGTAGHIDHGKTALVRALTGIDTDRLPEERRRGMTIDLGFARLSLEGVDISIVDVPGHERFVRNMLAGATGIDLAMLIVAADDSVMPQTREHFDILKLLRVPAGLIVVTKCDLVEEPWLDLVEADIGALVRGSFLEGAPIVRTSAARGEGIDDLRTAIARVVAQFHGRDDPGLFRLAIDRAFSVAGHGTVVTGTIASGCVAVGDELEVMPSGGVVRVRGLHRHDQRESVLKRGSRAALNLVGLRPTDLRRGREIAERGYLRPSRILTVELHCADAASRALKHRCRYRVHLGTNEVSATLALLDSLECRPGEPAALGQLFLSEEAVAVHGEPLILRAESPVETLGGGIVLQPNARRLRRNDLASRRRLEGPRSANPADRLAAAFGFLGLAATSVAELCRVSGVAAGEVAGLSQSLKDRGELIELPTVAGQTRLLAASTIAELESRILRLLGRRHEAHPRQSALPRAALRSALPDLPRDALLDAVLARLEARGEIILHARTVALVGFQPRLSQAERRLKAELAERIRLGEFSPPDQQSLAVLSGNREGLVAELLTLLVEEGLLVNLGAGLYLDADAEAEMQARVIEHLQRQSTLTMAQLRDILNSSRKFALPIGEYLDRIGLTERDGDVRRLRPGASSEDSSGGGS